MYFEENLVLIPLFMYKNFFKPLIGILLSFFGLMVCCIPMIIIAITITVNVIFSILVAWKGRRKRVFRTEKHK